LEISRTKLSNKEELPSVLKMNEESHELRKRNPQGMEKNVT